MTENQPRRLAGRIVPQSTIQLMHLGFLVCPLTGIQAGCAPALDSDWVRAPPFFPGFALRGVRNPDSVPILVACSDQSWFSEFSLFLFHETLPISSSALWLICVSFYLRPRPNSWSAPKGSLGDTFCVLSSYLSGQFIYFFFNYKGSNVLNVQVKKYIYIHRKNMSK